MTKRNWARLIALAVVLVLFLILIFQNIEVVSVRILFWTPEISKSLMLILTFLLGAIVGILAGLQMSRSRRK